MSGCFSHAIVVLSCHQFSLAIGAIMEPKKDKATFFSAKPNPNLLSDKNDQHFGFPTPLYLSKSNCKRIVDLLNAKDPKFAPKKISRGVMAKLPKPETKVQSKNLVKSLQPSSSEVKPVIPKKSTNVKRPASPEPIPSTSWQVVPPFYESSREEEVSRKKTNRYNPVVEVVERPRAKVSSRPVLPPSPPRLPPTVPQGKKAFQAVYGRYKPYKKNKEWTYDGFVITQPSGLILYDCSGKVVGRNERSQEMNRTFEIGSQVVIGQFECELSELISLEDFESGAFFASDF